MPLTLRWFECEKSMARANVFIIESLRFVDEENDAFEGRFLSQILHLSGKESIYYYVRTKKELKEVLKRFHKSDYRYLHLSCHGNEEEIRTTIDPISFSEFSQLAKPYLKDKRLFISACSAVNHKLADAVIRSCQCFSIIGPANKVPFGDAAIIWASFYHLVFREDAMRMRRADIMTTLKSIAKTFVVPMNYVYINKKDPKGYRFKRIPAW